MTAAHQLDGAPESARAARCLRRHVVGEPCPSCWYVRGEDAGGGRPARRLREPTRSEVLLGGLSAAAEEICALRSTIGQLTELLVRSDLARHRAVIEAHRAQDQAADVEVLTELLGPGDAALDDPEFAAGGRAGDPALVWDDVDVGGSR